MVPTFLVAKFDSKTMLNWFPKMWTEFDSQLLMQLAYIQSMDKERNEKS